MDCERRHYRCDVRYHYRRFIWPKNDAEISPQLGPRDEDRPAVNGKENDDEAKKGKRRRWKELGGGRNGVKQILGGKEVFFTPTHPANAGTPVGTDDLYVRRGLFMAV